MHCIHSEHAHLGILKVKPNTSAVRRINNTSRAVTREDLQDILAVSDLCRRVYEGGFKVWECSLDLLDYLSVERPVCVRVLELGCGHALPGLYCKKVLGASALCLQDYNQAVIEQVCVPNLLLNGITTEDDVSLCSGDWSDPQLHSALGHQCFDLVLSSETLYDSASMRSLHDVLDRVLSAEGVALLSSKRYYYGVGGSVFEFIELCASVGVFRVDVVHSVEQGVCRDILSCRRVP
jgi:hypothetical protein